MRWFVDERKLNATAGSMHQFCQVVRTIFPGPVDDDVVESTTVFLYAKLSQEVFGKRFAVRLCTRLRDRLKYTMPAEVEIRIARIARGAEALERGAEVLSSARSPGDKCRNHVVSVVESLLAEAGFRSADPELLRETYPKLEDVVRRIREHLLGIKRQNHFVMKNMSRA